ncbi:hypothetical protein P3S68_015248 [Capsicum galapagoense]
MLNSNIFVTSCSVSLRWLVCGFQAGPPHHTKSKEGLVVSNKDIESGIMDETKSQEIESLKEENLRLRQQMMEMYRAWASGLPLPPFPTFVPANTLSLPPKSESQFLTVVDTSQHTVESISRQIHPNAFASHSLAPQYKPTTFIAPHTVCAFIAQPSTEASTLPINTTVVLPQSASGPMFKALDGHCYTLEPTVKLRGTPKFLTKKPSIPEKSEKIVGKVKSAVNAMKNSLGPAGKEDVSYKDWGMPLSANLPPIFEMEPGGKENEEDASSIAVGRRARSRRPRCRHSQAQTQVHAQAPHNHSQNLLYSAPPPPYVVYNAQPYVQPPSYPQWNIPTRQSRLLTPQTYKNPSKPNFLSKPNDEMRQKSRDSFTPIGESYANLFQRLVQ